MHEGAAACHAWVSQNNERCWEILPLEDAIKRGRVSRIASARWREKYGGKRVHTGDLFVPADWDRQKSKFTVYAVQSSTWPYGRIETVKNKKNPPDVVAELLWDPPGSGGSTPRTRWTEEHLLIALNLYSKIPFGRFHKDNPVLIEVAQKMGRTSASLAMKLGNLASLDPVFRASGRRGLDGASRKDQEMWAAFAAQPAEMGPKSEQLLHDLLTSDPDLEVEVSGGDRLLLQKMKWDGPTEAKKILSVRLGQSFFRGAVLTAYNQRCCISTLSERRLLEAAHIKSWTEGVEHRHDPRNGLCLSKLHHGAFDAGLITLDEDLRVVLSPQLREHYSHPLVEASFVRHEGKRIASAQQNASPGEEFLAWHREKRFLSR